MGRGQGSALLYGSLPDFRARKPEPGLGTTVFGEFSLTPQTADQAAVIFGSLMGCCPDDSVGSLMEDLARAAFRSFGFHYGYDADTKLWTATGVDLEDYRDHWRGRIDRASEATVLELNEIGWDIARHCMVKLHGAGGSKALPAAEIAEAYEELAGKPISEDDGLVLCASCRRRVEYEKTIDAEVPGTDPNCVSAEFWDEEAGCYRGYLCGSCANQ